jgi:hypothetical protein
MVRRAGGPPPLWRSSTKRSSTALKATAAGLALVLIGVAALAVVLYRRIGGLEDAVSAQRAALDDLEAQLGATTVARSAPSGNSKPSPGEPLGHAAGASGKNVTSLLACIGGPDTSGATPGDLFGGGEQEALPPQRQVRHIADEVEQLRELRYDHPVEAHFLGDRAIEHRISSLFLKDYSHEVATHEGRILGLLGAVPPGSDMVKLRQEVLEGQVAGFYVPQTKELVVRSSGDIGGVEKVTLAHELEHALADQTFDLPVPEHRDPSRPDEGLAALAVVEGDATLTMQRYAVQNLPLDEQLGLAADPDVLQAQGQLQELPHYLQRELAFPYVEGLAFVCDLYTEGGWDAVDAAYSRPPTSSDQILFPERYRAREQASDPSDSESLEDPWHKQLSSSFGAAELEWLVEAPGGDTGEATDARAAAQAWGGGELTLWTRGKDSALGIALVQRSDATGLCETLTGWYEAANPDALPGAPQNDEALVSEGADQDAVVTCSGRDVRIGIAPDLQDARALTR